MEKDYVNEVVQNILTFYNDAKHVDVKFQVKCGHCWKSFFAHKLVLSLWSSVWAEKLKKIGIDFEEYENVIEITDISLTTFDALLKFLYGSSTEIENNKSNVKFVLNLYKAAEKYKIKHLENYCLQLLTKPDCLSPDKDNVFELLNAAIYIDAEHMKLRCHKFIQTYTEEVLKSRNLATISVDMILIVLKSPCLSLSSEYEVASWIYDWANFKLNKNKNENAENENHKDIIQPFLPYINFTALKPHEFATLVSKNKAFFDEMDCFQIFMNISLPGSSPLPVWHLNPKNKRKFKNINSEIKNEDLSVDTLLKAENQSFEIISSSTPSMSDENDSNLECGKGFNTSLIKNETIAITEKNAARGYDPDVFSLAKADIEAICSSDCIERPSSLETKSDDLSGEIVIGQVSSISNINQVEDSEIIKTATSITEDDTISCLLSGNKLDSERQQEILSNTAHKKSNQWREENKLIVMTKESLLVRKKIGKTKKSKKLQSNQGFSSLPCLPTRKRSQDGKFSSGDDWLLSVSESLNRLGLSKMI